MTADGHVVNQIANPDDKKHWAKITIDRMMAEGLALFLRESKSGIPI